MVGLLLPYPRCSLFRRPNVYADSELIPEAKLAIDANPHLGLQRAKSISQRPGVAIDGESKAYPAGPLNRREVVNDELTGIPIPVTW